MGMLQNRNPPNVPLAPGQYDRSYQDQLANVLRLFFNEINAVQKLNLAGLNLDLKTLPTDADFNSLRLGDVYRDTQDGTQLGSQMLRVKTSLDVVNLAGIPATGAVGTVTTTKSVGLTGVSADGAVGTVTT
jgi:hypothetical protein